MQDTSIKGYKGARVAPNIFKILNAFIIKTTRLVVKAGTCVRIHYKIALHKIAISRLLAFVGLTYMASRYVVNLVENEVCQSVCVCLVYMV